MDTRFLLYFVLPLSLGMVITLVGAILLLINSRKKPKAGEIDIGEWSTTGGQVRSARLGERQTDDTYEPVVEYVYTVNAAQYHGNKIFPGPNAGSKKEAAQGILDKHPVNMYVPVRYNPNDPSESALEAQPHPMNYIALGGWVLTAFGVCTCCFTAFMTFVIFGTTQ
jgi:hypothetical protein